MATLPPVPPGPNGRVFLPDDGASPAVPFLVRPAPYPLELFSASLPHAQKVDVSIVIPLLNEVESLPLLYERIITAMAAARWTFEVILVDDGSTDGSFEALQALAQTDERLRAIRLRRNFGQTAAFTAGFDMAQGDIVVTMDADLQNDPADIPMLLEKMEQGYDIVSGWRIRRQDDFLLRKLPSRLANGLISKTTGIALHDYGCSLKAYRSDVVKNLRLYGELHRFIPALASWMGIRVAEVPVNHYARQFGRSKYGLRRTIKVLLDLITVKFLLDYATRPIQIFGLLGMGCFGVGTALGVYLSILRLFFAQPLSDRPLLLLAVLLVILGVQLIAMGLLGELIVRTYYEAQRKPIYMVREVVSRKRAGESRRDGAEDARYVNPGPLS